MYLTGREPERSKKLFILLYIRRLALLFIPTLFAAGFFGLWLGTWAAIAIVIAVLVFYYRNEKAAVDCMQETYLAREEKVCNLLSQHVDYFNDGKTIVAVNINEGKIAFSEAKPVKPKLFSHPLVSILKGTPKIDPSHYEEFTIDINSLDTWRSSETVPNEYIGQIVNVTQIGSRIHVDSRADTNSLNTQLVNQGLQSKAAETTGLYIHTTDLAHVSLFLCTDIQTANTLVVLLQKLVDGELPSVDSPQKIGK